MGKIGERSWGISLSLVTIGRVDFLVALVSEASVGSDWCRKELALAMTGEINGEGIDVLPLRVDSTPMPPSLTDKLYLDVRRDDLDEAVRQLVESMNRHLSPQQPLPERLRAKNSPPRRTRPVRDAAVGSVKIVRIDTDGITEPRSDGTRGSALYSVPFKLNAIPDPRWSRMLPGNWDRPPEWGLMHRPGICRVAGDSIILDGTTIGEVEEYHLKTLKLAVGKTNDDFNRLRYEIQNREALQEERQRERDRTIHDSLSRMDFD